MEPSFVLKTPLACLGLAAAQILLGPGAALAWEWDTGSAWISTDIEAGAGVLFADEIAPTLGVSSDGETLWGEGYIEPGINGALDLGGAGTLSGRISAVGTLTRGDGDPGGYSTGRDDDVALEHAFVRYCSAGLDDEGACQGRFELAGGRMDYRVGDGFVIWDGNLDQFGKGAIWFAPRSAFELAGTAALNGDGYRAEAFYLKSDEDQDNTELAGLNIDIPLGDFATLGGTYAHVLESDFDLYDQRAGMNMVSVRANDVDLSAALPGLSFHGEYVREFGDGKDGAVDAYAWYAELVYTFEDLPWTPTIAYRYAEFSGERNDGDGTSEAFDPLFYEGDEERGWGTWVQGEIMGGYFLFNSNQITHMVHLSAYPSDTLGIGAIYYDFSLEEPNYYTEPLHSRHFAREVDLYVDWEVNENLYISAAYGVAFPQSAAEELFGTGATMHTVEAGAFLYF